MDKNELLDILKKEPIRNMSIIGFVENNTLEKVFNDGKSFIIIAESDHKWAYVSSTDREELKRIIDRSDIPTKYYANIENWMLPIITEGYQVEWQLKTRRYYFPEDKDIKEPVHAVDNLREGDIEVILEHSLYAEHLSHELLKKRMEEGISAAVRVDSKLAAWGMTHDDKSLGFLHVIEKYRQRGFAQDIGRSLIKKKREMGEAIYINIEVDNEKSIKLSEGMGFKYDREISWLKLSEK